MTDIVWGDRIEVNAKRPHWIGDDQKLVVIWDHANGIVSQPNAWTPALLSETRHTPSWDAVYAIRLPADHWAYKPLNAGLEPWAGGKFAPSDLDSAKGIMFRDGLQGPCLVTWWTHDGGDEGGEANDSDIIGYHPKTITQPSPADTATVRVMSEDEARAAFVGATHIMSGENAALDGWLNACRHFGLIRPATKSEQIATKTGLSVKDVEAVLAAAGKGE